jgi:hypothetical protein
VHEVSSKCCLSLLVNDVRFVCAHHLDYVHLSHIQYNRAASSAFLSLIKYVYAGDKRCGHSPVAIICGSKQLLSFRFDIFLLPDLHVFQSCNTVTGINALENTDSPFNGNQNIHLTTSFSKSFPPLFVHTVITIT